MATIASHGAYVPPTRLPLGVIAGRPPREGEPERAVAWFDEDAVTLGVAAGMACLRGLDRAGVDGLFFASTTHPFAEKQTAALAARALDLRPDVRAVDFGGSLRAGLDALRAACDAVDAGSARAVLVVASDVRPAAPRSPLERSFGDAAAAFLVQAGDDGIATVEGWHAHAEEIVDVWRTPGDRFTHAWEERFVVQEGYVPNAVAGVRGLLQATGAAPADVSAVALAGPDARSHGTAARRAGLEPAQLQDPLFGRVGNAGAAFAPLLLAAALEKARPGDRLAAVAVGDGATAVCVRATANIDGLAPRRGVAWHLPRRRVVGRYDAVLQARGLFPREWEPPRDPGLSATVHFRERDEDLSFRAQRCRACGAEQFPKQRLCETCRTRDDFELVRLSDRTGRVVTFTRDHFFPTPEPPTVVTITEFEGGARVHLQLVDVAPDDVQTGLAVEPVFRRIHEVGGRPNYYWKARPLAE